LGDVFWDWGIPTAVSIVEVSQSVNVPVIASGGIRSGVDVAKALCLGSRLASLSQPILQAAVKGTEATIETLSLLIDELRNVMFLVGANSVRDLHSVPIIITGKTAEWLTLRGYSVENYARRDRV
jgi:isopentenyl-diphosphate delta-isomerase